MPFSNFSSRILGENLCPESKNQRYIIYILSINKLLSESNRVIWFVDVIQTLKKHHWETQSISRKFVYIHILWECDESRGLSRTLTNILRLFTDIYKKQFRQSSDGRSYIILAGLTLPQFHACPKLATGCPMPFIIVFFVFNGLRWEVMVCFVLIGGIVDHHCSNFLLIKLAIFFILIMLHTNNFIY